MRFHSSVAVHYTLILLSWSLQLLSAQASSSSSNSFIRIPVAFVPIKLGLQEHIVDRTPRGDLPLALLSWRGGAAEEEGQDEDDQVLDFDSEDDEENDDEDDGDDGDVKVAIANDEEEDDDEEDEIEQDSTPKLAKTSKTAGLKKSVPTSTMNASDDEMNSREKAAKAPLDAKMVKSAIQASKKSISRQSSIIKKEISGKLVQTASKQQQTKSKSTSSSSSSRLLKLLHVPYIVRATLNPITFFRMTRAYFASLFNLNYLKEEQAQTLRSAMEEKAKKAPPSSSVKGKRSFKPGQSKSISDLPQLNTCSG